MYVLGRDQWSIRKSASAYTKVHFPEDVSPVREEGTRVSEAPQTASPVSRVRASNAPHLCLAQRQEIQVSVL